MSKESEHTRHQQAARVQEAAAPRAERVECQLVGKSTLETLDTH